MIYYSSNLAPLDFSLDVKTTRSEFPMQAEIGKKDFIERRSGTTA